MYQVGLCIYCATCALTKKNDLLLVSLQNLRNIATINRGQSLVDISHSPHHIVGSLICQPSPHGTRLVPPLRGQNCDCLSLQLPFVQTAIKPLSPPSPDPLSSQARFPSAGRRTHT